VSTQYYHPDLSLILAAEDWQPADKVSALYADVFNHQGLLTDQLKSLSIRGIHVECVSQLYNQAKTSQRRDVVIFVDDEPQVLASTIIPADVLKQYPKLASLGNKPIGEHLESNYGATRSESQVQRIDRSDYLNKNSY